MLNKIGLMAFVLTGFVQLTVNTESAANTPLPDIYHVIDFDQDNIETIDSDCEAEFSQVEIVPGLVMFINLSVPNGQLEYAWDFGDGTTSTDESPVHAFEESGSYNVCLSISDSVNQCEDVFCEAVFVAEPYSCEADFMYEIDPVSPGTVFFSDISAGFPETWLWDFGDGNFSIFPSVEHVYNAPGEYTVCLSISNSVSGCFDTYCDTVLIDLVQPCQADFYYIPVVNEPRTFQFFDQSIGDIQSWQWDFGDGGQSLDPNPVYDFAEPGYYDVCLTVIDASGECTSIFCEPVDATGTSPDCFASFSFEQDSLDYMTFHFQDQSVGDINEWFWTFGDGESTGEQNPTHTFAIEGPYQVTLNILSNSGLCQDQAYKYVVVVDGSTCEADFEFNTNPANPYLVEFTDFSSGAVDAWFWDFGDGFISPEQNPAHEYDEPGLYTVTLITSNNNLECLSMITKDVMISQGNDCQAFFTYSVAPEPATIFFNDLSQGEVDEWLWDFGDGFTSDEQHPAHTYEEPGIYPVCLTITDNSGECFDVFCMDVEVFSTECIADFEYETLEGDPFTILFTDLSTPGVEMYNWDFGDGDSATIQNPVHQFQAEGEYEVCLTIYDLFRSCWDTTCKQLTIPMQADCEAAFSYVQDPVDPFIINFMDESVGEITSWNWDFGDGNTSDEPSPVHVYVDEGVFEVCLEVMDISGYCISLFCEDVLVEAPGYCTADFEFEVLQDELLTVAFSDLSQGPIDSWAWDFGDGMISMERNPVHSYADTGIYTVSLSVYNTDSLNFCSDSITKQVLVYVEVPACVADFVMHPDSGVNKPLLYHFHDLSENQPDQWLWDFGDGSTSSDQNPVHQYEEPGDYEVSLTVTKFNPWGDDCVDTKTEDMQTPDYFHIGGFVYAGHFPINNPEPTGDTALVYLYRYHDDQHVVNIDTTVVIEYGYFHSLFLLEDHYLIKFRLTDGSSNAPYFFPTYFGDKKRWQHSPTLFLADSSHYNINVHLAEVPDLESGVGAINGAVVHHSNADARVPAYDSEILIFNSNNQAVSYKYSDENGAFTFENLTYDTYTLYAESTGLFTDPVTVTLNEINPTAFDVQLELFESDPTSINDFTGVELPKLEVFPNPASDRIIVNTDLSGDLRIAITDLTGREICADKQQQVDGQTVIDISALTKGIYFLQVSSVKTGFNEAVKFVKVSE